MEYYPVYLNLENRCCVVIGGGRMAEEKVEGLLRAGAKVTVIWPQLTRHLQALAAAAEITHIARQYRYGDLEGAFVAISAVSDADLNEEAWQEAQDRNILMNVMDDVPHCNFIAPSILRQGDLIVAVSTSGKAPALAVRLRQQLERALGAEYARFLELAGGVRAPLLATYPDFEERRQRWYRLVDSDVLELLRQGEEDAAIARIEEIMGVAPNGGVA